MAVNKDAFVAAFENIFRSLTAAQLSSLSDSLAEVAADALGDLTTDEMSLSVPSGAIEPEDEPEPGMSATANARSSRSRSLSAGNKRVVNGFICFRSFYSRVFHNLPQRCRSGLLREMWAAEARRNLFGLLGKAFSDLRDNNSALVSMDAFLACAAEVIPLVPADQYLAKMGWYVQTEVEGTVALHRAQNFNAAAVNLEYPPQTSLSVADIVKHCYSQGLVSGATRKQTNTGLPPRAHRGIVNMAVAAAPAPPPQPQGPAAQAPPCIVLVDARNETIDFETQHSLTETDSPPSITTSSTESSASDEPAPYLTIEEVIADQQAAYEQLEIGFHFHPAMPQHLAFDPRIIQDDFDPFDLDFVPYVNFNNRGEAGGPGKGNGASGPRT